MCDDHAATRAAEGDRSAPVGTDGPVTGVSRRNFMHGTAALAAGGALLGELPRRLPLSSAARPAASDGTSAYSMAMHIHSSFSEQDGSMDAQLYQATTSSVDVLWWTDHDNRMDGKDFRDTVHFTSLTEEKGAPGQGGAWKWRKVESGPLSGQSGGGIVTSPSSPDDPVSGGSMHLNAKSNGGGVATYGYYGDCKPAGWNYRDNLTGQSLSIDVLLSSGWTDGYLELLIATSYHQGSAGRPAGDYSLSYRFVPEGQSTRQSSGLLGVITIPVRPSGGDPWYTATITPSEDIFALWPDLDYRDFALWGLTLNAASTGDDVDGYFDYLRFNRSISGDAFLSQQAEMMTDLAGKYPNVVQQQGLEISWLQPHLNWFGGNVVLPDYGNTSPGDYTKFLAQTAVPQIHKSGGLVSYNHPFGYSSGPPLPPNTQNQMLAQVAGSLLPTRSTAAVLGCDLLEVGYNLRSGVNLAHHVELWDIMSRNAIFLTGNGTSDDHFGQDWPADTNNWITSAWAPSTSSQDLVGALAAGRAWCGSLSGYRGSLDLLVDGSSPMGSASVSPANSRRLLVSASSIPANGSVQVLQGEVDYAGTSGLQGNTQVIGTYRASSFSGGSVSLSLDTSRSSFVRSQVLDSSGTVVGLSNPAWLLRSQPPGGIPGPRAA